MSRSADDASALAFQQLLAERWATAAVEQSTRDAGQPGARLRCYRVDQGVSSRYRNHPPFRVADRPRVGRAQRGCLIRFAVSCAPGWTSRGW
ncbi:DUF6207 family protein [Streptomyces sp. NPDC046862]|uniref:DUF6207 family protein n=1 Tax=Streptomyces sp. NPDC046862 TaxID=3154603 RepID=UPI003455998D